MAKRTQISTRDYLLTLLQTHTQKEVAQITGLGERTIRRIKNEPGHKTIARTETIVRTEGAKEYKRLRRPSAATLREITAKQLEKQALKQRRRLELGLEQLRATGAPKRLINKFKREQLRKIRYIPKRPRTTRLKIRIPRLAVMPPWIRKFKTDPYAPDSARVMQSETIEFNVKKLNEAQILELLQFYRGERDYTVNILYWVPAGGRSLGGHTYPKNKVSATGWLDIGVLSTETKPENPVFEFSDTDLQSMIESMQEIQFTSGKRARKTRKQKQNIAYVQVQRRPK